ncbi:MAG: hypothetical protein IV100_08045 [Myxococcales bacterium]|nr:hypothetical protein [Myxococcales bacterium]
MHFEGVLRLDVSEYDPIAELLDLALKKGSDSLTLKLVDLTFLNSSGLNVLYKFAISARKQGDTPIVVRAAKNVPWQVKSLPNLKKFNRNIEVVFDD